jgi:AAA+ superfamily predicted ATPase
MQSTNFLCLYSNYFLSTNYTDFLRRQKKEIRVICVIRGQKKIENFEGVLIAAASLTQNTDKTFEHRFLYKIEFETPNAEAKKMICLSMTPALSTYKAEDLTEASGFSGGQRMDKEKQYLQLSKHVEYKK